MTLTDLPDATVYTVGMTRGEVMGGLRGAREETEPDLGAAVLPVEVGGYTVPVRITKEAARAGGEIGRRRVPARGMWCREWGRVRRKDLVVVVRLVKEGEKTGT